MAFPLPQMHGTTALQDTACQVADRSSSRLSASVKHPYMTLLLQRHHIPSSSATRHEYPLPNHRRCMSDSLLGHGALRVCIHGLGRHSLIVCVCNGAGCASHC